MASTYTKVQCCRLPDCWATARKGGAYCSDAHRQQNRLAQDRARERARSGKKSESRKNNPALANLPPQEGPSAH